MRLQTSASVRVPVVLTMSTMSNGSCPVCGRWDAAAGSAAAPEAGGPGAAAALGASKCGRMRSTHSWPFSTAVTAQRRRLNSAHKSLRFGAESSTTNTRTGGEGEEPPDAEGEDAEEGEGEAEGAGEARHGAASEAEAPAAAIGDGAAVTANDAVADGFDSYRTVIRPRCAAGSGTAIRTLRCRCTVKETARPETAVVAARIKGGSLDESAAAAVAESVEAAAVATALLPPSPAGFLDAKGKIRTLLFVGGGVF